MNLQPRTKSFEGFKEILANSANVSWRAITLDGTKFNGKVSIGTAVSIDPTTSKAKPWEDGDVGEPVLTGRDIIINGNDDVVITAIEGGIVFEAKCTGITPEFKEKCKLIKFR